MYSITLTREANTETHRDTLRSVLARTNFIVTELAWTTHYSGFLIQNELSSHEKGDIWEFIQGLSDPSCVYFREGIKLYTENDAPRPFDFEDYDGTDINGHSLEMLMEKTINDVSKDIRKVIKNPITRTQSCAEIADLWIRKIREWKELNKA